MLREAVNIGATPYDIQKLREQLAKIEADNRRKGKLRFREVLWVSILVAGLVVAPLSALFSWVFSRGRMPVDINFVGYLGLVAIVLTIIGIAVFFYITFLTMRRSNETNDMLNEIDEQRKDRRKFDDFIVSNLDEQHKDIQEIKDLIDRGKRSE